MRGTRTRSERFASSRPGSFPLLKFFEHRSLSGPDVLRARSLAAPLAIQVLLHVTAARLVLIDDGWSVGRGPAVAPFRQRDDHRFEIQTLFRQVIRRKPLSATRGGHEAFLHEALQPRGEN